MGSRCTFGLFVLLVFFATACGGTHISTHVASDRVRIHQYDLSVSNVYVVETDAGAVVVDAGDPGEAGEILEAMEASEVDRSKVGLIVITHGHADHTGSAKALSAELGIPVAVQEGDVGLVRSGHNPRLNAMNLTGVLLKPFLEQEYPAYDPEVVYESCLDLRPYGVPAFVLSTPGHTLGSASVVIKGGHILVGDLILGGYLGGRIAPKKPGEYYYQYDRVRVRGVIEWLVESGARRLYLGHGGPVSGERVREALKKGKFGPDEGHSFSPGRCE